MYTANRVKETSTTTGTGNITLAGASTAFKSFTSQYDLNVRFPYFIESTANTWECGIGYLSGTTTLVREIVLDNSAGTLVAISFTGTLIIFVNHQATSLYTCTGGDLSNEANPHVKSGHFSSVPVPLGLGANTEYYVPFQLTHAGYFDAFNVAVRTASGTGSNLIHMALYARNSNGLPGELIVSALNVDPSSTGYKDATFTKRFIPAGWYYAWIWSDVTPAVQAQQFEFTNPANIGFYGSVNYGFEISMYTRVTSSIAVAPDPASVSLSRSNNIDLPIVRLRVAT